MGEESRGEQRGGGNQRDDDEDASLHDREYRSSLGLLLTLVTIWIVPAMLDLVGWRGAFTILALGPAFGIWSMLTLRNLPEAVRMASGRR